MLRFDPTELRKYGGLTLVAKGIVEGFLTGIHRSPFKGFSVEFAEHRPYVPGDEIRHIDWRAFGKTDRYYVKEYEEETNLKAYLVVDASGSMGFRGAKKAPSKLEYARQVAGSLAYLMLHQADAVGLITHDTKIRALIPPKASPKHLLQLLRTLEEAAPGGDTSAAVAWDELAAHHLKRRGLVVILSDFLDDISPMIRALQHLRHRNHEVMLFHVMAPEEMDFPYKRLTQFRGMELGGEKKVVDPRRLRDDYLKNLAAFQAELRDRAGKLQVDYHLMRTDDPVANSLGIYLNRRMAR